MITKTNTPKKSSQLLGVIFDIDGVLLDSRHGNISYYNAVRAAVGLDPMGWEDEEYCHMSTAKQCFERIIPQELLSTAIARSKELSYNSIALPQLSLHAGVVDLLTQLKDSGIRIGVCTNRMEKVNSLLQHFGIEQFFHPIKTAENCMPKPSPQGLLKIIEEWQVPAGTTRFIGDTLADQGAANSAQIPFWAYQNSKLQAQMHINDFFVLASNIMPLVEKKKSV